MQSHHPPDTADGRFRIRKEALMHHHPARHVSGGIPPGSGYIPHVSPHRAHPRAEQSGAVISEVYHV